MINKNIKQVLAALSVVGVLSLSACANVVNESQQADQENQEEGQEATLSSIITTSDNRYRPVVRDGTYQQSRSKGITQRLNSTVNLQSFETGLMERATKHYNINDYYFEEGQYLSPETVEAWINRQSESNPDGLNPPEEGEDGQRQPIYLESILEQDFYVESENGFELGGIMVGLAMNRVDYYQDGAYGPPRSQEISRDEMLAQSLTMIEQMLGQIREVDELKNVPIVFSIFEQSPKDDLAGGVYIGERISQSGTDLSNLEQLNYSKVVLPLEGEESSLWHNFSSFKDDITSFSPDLAGVTGIGYFENDVLQKLTIDITAQFYGEGEVTAFTQYVETSALNYLPDDVPVEISIDSIDDVEAFLYTDRDSNQYFSHIFN